MACQIVGIHTELKHKHNVCACDKAQATTGVITGGGGCLVVQGAGGAGCGVRSTTYPSAPSACTSSEYLHGSKDEPQGQARQQGSAPRGLQGMHT
jgi:hypothetical protein